MNAWVLAKHRDIGSILVEQDALRADDRQMLEQMVDRHVQLHQGDPGKSLAGLSSIGSVGNDLQSLADADVERSLAHVSADRDLEIDATLSFGTTSSVGERFRILRPHAKGGLGEVFVALDNELHREVALKQIQNWHADNTASRNRFVMEAEITGGLQHPGIVPVYGLGQDDKGRPFYAMKFIRGDSLKAAIKQYHDQKHDPHESKGHHRH